MKVSEIINKKTGERLISFGGEDFENVNPAQHFYESCLVSRMMMLEPDETSGRKEPTKKGAETLVKVAESCKQFIDKFRKVQIPSELTKLLETTKKREQKKLLNGLRMNPDILMSFLLMAGDKGFKLSQYQSEHQTKAVDLKKMPMAYRKKADGTIEKFGKTELTDGQLKQALEQRSVKVAKILEKDNEWHCFFLTFNSIGGKENWQNGQPHLHYISDLFGIEKKDVIEQIKSKKYNLGNLPHIALDDYGKQPDKKAST